VQWIFDTILWLMSLAKPDNLLALLNLGGPPWVGYLILTAIIFAETGLLVGFFLPGDSLLFSAGFLASTGRLDIFLLIGLLIVAAIVGDGVNYFLGLQAGEHVFEKGRQGFLRSARWQGHCVGAVRATGAHVYAVRGRHSPHALPRFCVL
jgi:membrane-associated protein